MTKKSLCIGLTGVCLLFIGACQPKKKGTFSVSGTFKNADKLAAVEGPVSKVYLLEVTYGKDQPPVILDSAKIPAVNGSFSLTGSAPTQEIFELVFGNNVIAVPLINDAAEVKVNVDLAKKDDFYEVRGTSATNQLKIWSTSSAKRIMRSKGQWPTLTASNRPMRRIVFNWAPSPKRMQLCRI